MFKKINKLKIFVITILISMVFAVNIGFTFSTANDLKAEGDYKMDVSTDADSTTDRKTYLNDIVVNNSTINIPIAYTLGTVQREINFDYSFSESMDVAVTYELNYTDGTEANNVIMNVVNRDRFIIDQMGVGMDNSTLAYNSSSSYGTMFYLDSISGTGNMKLFSGVTFLAGNNKVNSYKADSDVTVGTKEYNQGSVISSVEYQHKFLEISRFWEAYELNSLNQPTSYICETGYSITANATTTTVDSKTIIKTKAEYEAYLDSIETQISGYWTKGYRCVKTFTDGKTYTAGNVYSLEEYAAAVSLNSVNAGNFAVCYSCNTAYAVSVNEGESIIGSSNEISENTIISADDYALLLPEEQSHFSVKEYATFENKNLTIDVKVYTSVSNVSYTADHYFKTLKADSPQYATLAFSNWLKYKNDEISENIAMIYNGHARFENGIPYAIDFGASEDMTNTTAGSKGDLTSSYVYKKIGNNTYFYAYAGGNKYNAGVGVYYLTANSPTKLTVQVNASWYNSNGVIISSMPINNINLQYSNNETTSFTKNLSANSCGYVDVLDYVQTITKGDLFDMRGYSIVITSVTATFEDVGQGSENNSAVKVINSTSYNPILYTLSNQGVDTNLDFNITITNNSSEPIAIPTVTLSPTFTAYNGSTSISSDIAVGYGVANTVNGTQATGFEYVYDSTVWSVNGNVFTGNGYIAPYTSLVVASGVTVPTQSSNDFWAFNIGGSSDKSYFADYWFEVGVSYTTSSAQISYSAVPNYSSAEIMTSLTHTKESTKDGAVVSYIAIRNNTLQTITAINYEGTLQLSNTNNSVSYSVTNMGGTVTRNGGNSFTIVFSGLTLYPGESIYICKLNINAGQSYNGDYNVFLSSSSATVTLAAGDSSSRTGIYFKRDFASGNLSIVNGNTAGTAENGLQISGLTGLIDAGTKWNSSNQFIMQDETDSLARFRNGQIIHLLSGVVTNLTNYNYSNITIS